MATTLLRKSGRSTLNPLPPNPYRTQDAVGPQQLPSGQALDLAALVDRDQEDIASLFLVDLAVHADLPLLPRHAGMSRNGGVVDTRNHQVAIEIAGGHAVPVNPPGHRPGVFAFDPRGAEKLQKPPVVGRRELEIERLGLDADGVLAFFGATFTR